MNEPRRPATDDACAPAHLTRTAGEFLGRRPLPRVIAERSLLFLLGPAGCGKTTVALRVLGAAPLVIDGPALRAHLVSRARYGRFPAAVEHAPLLLLDGVDCLFGREGAVALLGALLQQRTARGLKTVVVQGPADDSVVLLYPSVPCQLRASALLRFPVGRGRRRYVQQECRRVGVPFSAARAQVGVEPWTYAGVRSAIEALAVGVPGSPEPGAVQGPAADVVGQP